MAGEGLLCESRVGLCGGGLLGVVRGFRVDGVDEGDFRSGEFRVGDSLEGLGFADGGTDIDAVVDADRREGFGGGGEVIEGAVVGGEVNNVLGDFNVVVAVKAFLVGEGADIGDAAGDGLAGGDGEGAGDGDDGLGGFGILEGLHLGVVCGEDGIGESAEGAVSGVSGLNGIHAVVGEGGVLLFVLGGPEGDDFGGGEEGGIVAVSVCGIDGVETGGVPGGEHGVKGGNGWIVLQGAGGVVPIGLLVPLEEAAGDEGDGGNDGGERV